VREIEPSPDAATALDAIVADLGRAQTLGRTAGVGVEAVAVGTNDDPGSDAINARLRAGRAGWLADALAGRGIANVRAASGDDAEALAIDARSAFVRLVVAEGAR
ncbi:MAG TPA: hypothetical protein VJ696_02055, partial [Rhodanobacteraceae bacterium]|nr:hypothetical protein [Rhodanobacteraceae bacterium]